MELGEEFGDSFREVGGGKKKWDADERGGTRREHVTRRRVSGEGYPRGTWAPGGRGDQGGTSFFNN